MNTEAWQAGYKLECGVIRPRLSLPPSASMAMAQSPRNEIPNIAYPPNLSGLAFPSRMPFSPRPFLRPVASTMSSGSHVIRPTTFSFSQADLDTILYGYIRNPMGGGRMTGHAISGLHINQNSQQIQQQQQAAAFKPVERQPTKATDKKDFSVDNILNGNFSKNGSASLINKSPASFNIPEGLALIQTSFAGIAHYGVFCQIDGIPKGTKFGPYKGRKIRPNEIELRMDNKNMWEIFQDGKLSHFIDWKSGGDWMTHVQNARFAHEQNLVVVQMNGEIYYEACTDIGKGKELLVWYGDNYLQFMGIPVTLKEMADGNNFDGEGAEERKEGYQCERCGKVFAYKYYKDKHLKYTRCVDQGNRKFPCHLCTRSFEKRDRLRIHILHVHEKHRPHKCGVCSKRFSQSSSLNKHMRVHSGERPYKCLYCSKAFTASSILRTHIRQHSGEKPFKCVHCLKAFASHAAHDSHVRRTHTKEKPCICQFCGKAFAQSYELKFHMNMHTGDKPYSCEKCGRGFSSPSSRDRHRTHFDCISRKNRAPKVARKSGINSETEAVEENQEDGGQDLDMPTAQTQANETIVDAQ